MLIEIKENIITAALKCKTQQNDPLDLLFQMAICAKKGYHVVWVPSLVEKPSLRRDLAKLLTEANVKALCYSGFMHNQDIGWLKSHADVSVVLSYNKEPSSNQQIVINPYIESEFEPYRELFFLVENLLDAEFYKVLLKIFRKQYKLSSYNCEFYPLMGGGVTSSVVMTNEVFIRKHFCLAITDSDKLSPNGPKGTTGEDLKKAMVGAPSFCYLYSIKDVMEIENLIPQRVVRCLFPLKAGEIDIFARNASFFDMKYGLKISSLFYDKDNEYWEKLLPEKSAFFQKRLRLKNSYPKKDPYMAAMKSNDEQILPGFCVHLLKRILLADSNSNETIVNDNIAANNLLLQTEYSHLSKAQQSEWDNIGKLLFSWSCGMKAENA